MRRDQLFTFSILFTIIYLFSPPLLHTEGIEALSDGQTIYVPAYSHIYEGNKETPILLTVTVSIRNTDPKHAIKVTKVDYYETEGKTVKKFISTAVNLKPLETIRYVIPNKDKAGGSGANFIVEWKSDRLTNTPIVETIMIGPQGMSFTSRGQVLIKTE